MFSFISFNGKSLTAAAGLFLFVIGGWQIAAAATAIKPFVLAKVYESGEIAEIVSTARDSLVENDFEIVGQYSPYADTVILAFTSEALRANATRSERGGYGAVMRASVTSNDGRIELAYSNPVYWANAYRMQDDLAGTRAKLDRALGFAEEFGTGDKRLSASDMREYHYTFMMEYFDDPSILAYFDSHREAVETIDKNLADRVAAAVEVYQLELGNDSEGRPMTLIGVGLAGEDADDCGSDAYIMGRIDKSTPRHSSHLPYEILVYGNQAEALYARFRIAISWPHLPMLASETGATFFSIMCAPGAIEKSLTRVAGGSTGSKSMSEK
jgi:hypothetical protein